MAVPKKKMSRSITKRRRTNWYRVQCKKMMRFLERAKRNMRGAEKAEESAPQKKQATVTKIAA